MSTVAYYCHTASVSLGCCDVLHGKSGTESGHRKEKPKHELLLRDLHTTQRTDIYYNIIITLHY